MEKPFAVFRIFRIALCLITVLISLTVSTRSVEAGYVTAGCAEDIKARIRREDQAQNEGDAGDYASSFVDYQQATIYRANCVDETSGGARKWNMFYEAEDYFFMSVQALSSESWKSDAPGYHDKAHDLANDLMNEPLPADLKDLVNALWKATKDPIVLPPSDDSPPL